MSLHLFVLDKPKGGRPRIAEIAAARARLLVCLELRREGRTVAELAKRFGKSRRTIIRWTKEAEAFASAQLPCR